MLTPQEVEERVFPKAKKGGYDMQDVDSFLDELTADYTELYKENAVLKRKMKVLADKITEYQETENAMRATLLAAQKMAKQITDEAEAKRNQILQEAENAAAQRARELAGEVAKEERRLKEAKASVAAMTTSIRELLAQEQAFLDALPQYEAEVPAGEAAEPAPAEERVDDVAGEIGDAIARMIDEPEEAPAPQPAAQEPVPQEEPAAEEPVLPVHRDDDIDDAPTRRLDLSELRFGRNYEIR